MDILIMVILIVSVVVFMSFNSKKVEDKLAEAERKRKSCPPHKWTYRIQPGTDDEYMICSNCGMLPGGYQSEVNNVED